MSLLFRALPVCALLLAQSPALAAARVQTTTLSVVVKPVLDGGQQIGCSMAFVTSQNISNRPAPREISGSLNYLTFPDRSPMVALKIAVASGTDARLVRPADVFLSDGKDINSVDYVDSHNSDSSGYRLFLYRTSDTTVMAAVERPQRESRFSFTYHLENENSQQIVTVDLAAGQATNDLTVAQQWGGCLKAVAAT